MTGVAVVVGEVVMGVVEVTGGEKKTIPTLE